MLTEDQSKRPAGSGVSFECILALRQPLQVLLGQLCEKILSMQNVIADMALTLSDFLICVLPKSTAHCSLSRALALVRGDWYLRRLTVVENSNSA
jgi:hypothetical protein